MPTEVFILLVISKFLSSTFNKFSLFHITYYLLKINWHWIVHLGSKSSRHTFARDWFRKILSNRLNSFCLQRIDCLEKFWAYKTTFNFIVINFVSPIKMLSTHVSSSIFLIIFTHFIFLLFFIFEGCAFQHIAVWLQVSGCQ